MSQPQLRGYPIDAGLRDRRPVTTPLLQAVPAWFRRVTGTD